MQYEKCKVNVTLLSDFYSASGDEKLCSTLTSLFESINKDVESFLKTKAVQSAKLYTSSTYLVSTFDSNSVDLLGYFTLAIKTLTVRRVDLSTTQEKMIKRFSSFDTHSASYKLPAILIAQFGRNFSKQSASISGAELMNFALEHIYKIFTLSSGKTVFLECEKKESLIRFYEGRGFFMLNNIIYSKDEKELVQMFRFI